MAEYNQVPRLTRNATPGRRRRANNAFQIPGSGQYNLPDIAKRSLLDELLTVISVSVNGITVIGNVTADGLVINSHLIDANTVRVYGTTALAAGADHDIVVPEQIILVNTGTTDRTITLPWVNTTAYANTVISVKKIDSGAGNAVVQGQFTGPVTNTVYTYQIGPRVVQASDSKNWQVDGRFLDLNAGTPGTYEQIDDVNTYVMNTQYSAVSVIGRSGKWYVVGSH